MEDPVRRSTATLGLAKVRREGGERGGERGGKGAEDSRVSSDLYVIFIRQCESFTAVCQSTRAVSSCLALIFLYILVSFLLFFCCFVLTISKHPLEAHEGSAVCLYNMGLDELALERITTSIHFYFAVSLPLYHLNVWCCYFLLYVHIYISLTYCRG